MPSTEKLVPDLAKSSTMAQMEPIGFYLCSSLENIEELLPFIYHTQTFWGLLEIFHAFKWSWRIFICLGLLRATINKLKQERSITPKLIFIRGGQDDATAFENYLIEEQDVDGSGLTSVMGFVSFLEDVTRSVLEYVNK